jgi:uncharacterized protein
MEDKLAPPRLTAVTESERIASIDVLRGFALLGILIMNIQSFAMIDAAYFNPTAYGNLEGANYAVWLLSHVLADQKFMTIFSMLFGAGIVLMTGRREQTGQRAAAAHYRRMGVLALFGLLHAYLLWHGDILFSYALCGMVAYLFRKLRPTYLLLWGGVCLLIPSILTGLFQWSLPDLPAEWRKDFVHEMQPTPGEVAAQVAAFHGGGWRQEILERAPVALAMQTIVFAYYVAWRAGGLMLVGMAFFKLGLFSAGRSKGLYLSLIAAALGLGIPIILIGVHYNWEHQWEPGYSKLGGSQFNYWASLVVSLGWVGLIMLACQSSRLRPLTRPLAAVGQMALTNYLLHTLICTTLFYGHGFGLFGKVDRVGQIGMVFAIWMFQLVASPLWLHYFRFGPVEWLWRALTYLSLPPMRRRAHPDLGMF